MKFIKNLLPLVILFISASNPVTVCNLEGNYKVTINGTSNLHDWDEKVEMISGHGEVSWNGDGSLNINSIDFRMDVHSIKSNNKVMNNNIQSIKG